MSNELERVLQETATKIDQTDVPITPPGAPSVTPIDNARPKPKGGSVARTPVPTPEVEATSAPIVWQKPNYFRGALDKIFGTAEHFKVYKRDELGGQTFIRSYVPKDLDVTRDFEEFIQKYLVPQFGEGQYDVVLINQRGENSRAQQFTVADPSRKGADETPNSKVMDMLMERIKGLEVAKSQVPQQKSMMETLQEVKVFMETLGAGGNKSDPLVMVKMIEMLRPPSPTGPDPAMVAVIEALKELKTLSKREPIALPPPLPPPEQPRETMAEMLAAVASVTKPSMDVKDIVALIRPPESGEKFGIKELIALAPILKDLLAPKQDPAIAALTAKIDAMSKPNTNTLMDSLQTYETVERLIMKRQPERTEGESFWGFLNNFAGNFAQNMEAMGNMVARIKEAESHTKGGTSPGASAPKKAQEGLTLPQGFDEHAAKIDQAVDAAERIQAVLMSFQFLATNGAKWRPFMMKVVGLVKKSKDGDEAAKAQALQFVFKFLQGLKEAGKIKADPAAILEEFKTHYNHIIEAMGV